MLTQKNLFTTAGNVPKDGLERATDPSPILPSSGLISSALAASATGMHPADVRTDSLQPGATAKQAERAAMQGRADGVDTSAIVDQAGIESAGIFSEATGTAEPRGVAVSSDQPSAAALAGAAAAAFAAQADVSKEATDSQQRAQAGSVTSPVTGAENTGAAEQDGKARQRSMVPAAFMSAFGALARLRGKTTSPAKEAAHPEEAAPPGVQDTAAQGVNEAAADARSVEARTSSRKTDAPFQAAISSQTETGTEQSNLTIGALHVGGSAAASATGLQSATGMHSGAGDHADSVAISAGEAAIPAHSTATEELTAPATSLGGLDHWHGEDPEASFQVQRDGASKQQPASLKPGQEAKAASHSQEAGTLRGTEAARAEATGGGAADWGAGEPGQATAISQKGAAHCSLDALVFFAVPLSPSRLAEIMRWSLSLKNSLRRPFFRRTVVWIRKDTSLSKICEQSRAVM
jgi:hypothetical protein